LAPPTTFRHNDTNKRSELSAALESFSPNQETAPTGDTALSRETAPTGETAPPGETAPTGETAPPGETTPSGDIQQLEYTTHNTSPPALARITITNAMRNPNKPHKQTVTIGNKPQYNISSFSTKHKTSKQNDIRLYLSTPRTPTQYIPSNTSVHRKQPIASLQNTANKTTPDQQLSIIENKQKHSMKQPKSNMQNQQPKHTYIDVIQANLQHKKGAMDTLGITLKGKKQTIVTLTEPYYNNKGIIPRVNKKMTLFYADSDQPRTAIGIHSPMEEHATLVDDLSDRDITTIKLVNDGSTIILASIYMDQNNPIPEEHIDKLTKRARDQKAALIITMDSNSHHQSWGDKNTDKRGTEIINTLAKNNLELANSGNKPTFKNSRSQSSVIDLTAGNFMGIQTIMNWKTSDEYTNSDHKYIRFQLQFETKCKKQLQKINNTDWEKFRSDTESSKTLKRLADTEISNQKTLDKLTEEFTDELNRIRTTNLAKDLQIQLLTRNLTKNMENIKRDIPAKTRQGRLPQPEILQE